MSTASPASHTLRIAFAYDGAKLEISSVQRVAMRAPAALMHECQAGYWLEVRDGDGRLLYQRPIHDPMRRDVESYGDAPGDALRRHPAAATKGEFEVLVPDLPGAQTFRLHGPKADTGLEFSPAASRSGPLSAHSFDELHRLAGRAAGQEGDQ
jgi:hypothetical protein